jgi:RHS repeat-associated protein
MTFDGGNRTYEWDAANRLVAINYLDTGNRTTFAYDGIGRRVKIVEYNAILNTLVEPTEGRYETFFSDTFLLGAGTYSLTIFGLDTNGPGNAALVDSVSPNALLPGGSFESPAVSQDTTAPAGTAWIYQGPSGIAVNGGFHASGVADAPDGSQAAFIETYGSITQTVSLAAGPYTLSFLTTQCSGINNAAQQLQVSLSGTSSVANAKTFVWCGNQICEERDATGGTVTKRFFAEGEQLIASDAANYYYTRDHLGSIREVTSSLGSLVARYDYDVWGKAVVLSGNMTVDFGYTGHYFHQPSGLNLAMYRVYSSTMARWTSRDPINDAEMLPEGPNMYAYVANQPTRLEDALGLQAATIQCNGRGGYEVMLNDLADNAGETCCGCVTRHENQHIKDWKWRYGQGSCTNMPKGSLPLGGRGYDSFLHASECRANKVEKQCIKGCIKKHPSATKTLQVELDFVNQTIDEECKGPFNWW